MENTNTVFVTADCMTFSPPINFPGQAHKVGDWIKDLDGRTTHQPHSTLSLRSHKIPHHILPPLLLDEFGPSSNIGFWSVQYVRREWVQSKQRRLGWFLWPLHNRPEDCLNANFLPIVSQEKKEVFCNMFDVLEKIDRRILREESGHVVTVSNLSVSLI